MIPTSGQVGGEAFSKPRASGDDPSGINVGNNFVNVNPARAGMIRIVFAATAPAGRKPRASGDDPWVTSLDAMKGA